MESATITKVTLRQEKLRSGKLSLYLDYYPPIWNPHIKKMSRREFLGLYLIGKPKDKFELDYNEEILLKARGIRATRELAIINEEFGFLDRTKKQATLPLSDEALSYCGEPGHGMVFRGLSRAHTREPFKKWLKDAGIKKKITFHGLRHTYATLLITNGTDIYTVSKMLTHKNVATTQIYAEVVNQKKRDAANSISLK